MKPTALFWCFLLLLANSCSTNEPTPASGSLIGTWRLYEVGGSPGFGYYVTPIAPEPLQFITFTKSNELRRRGKDLPYFLDVPNYRIVSAQNGNQLVLLKSSSGQTGFSMAYSVRNDTLRLTPTCYEGCHFGFVCVR